MYVTCLPKVSPDEIQRWGMGWIYLNYTDTHSFYGLFSWNFYPSRGLSVHGPLACLTVCSAFLVLQSVRTFYTGSGTPQNRVGLLNDNNVRTREREREGERESQINLQTDRHIEKFLVIFEQVLNHVVIFDLISVYTESTRRTALQQGTPISRCSNLERERELEVCVRGRRNMKEKKKRKKSDNNNKPDRQTDRRTRNLLRWIIFRPKIK